MRIFIVGKQNIMKWPENVQKFLVGHETELFLYNKITMASAFHKIFHRQKRYWYIGQQLKKRIESFKPDLIIYVSAFFIPQECYNILKFFPDTPRVGWVADAFGENEKTKADLLDMLFCADSGYFKVTEKFSCKSEYLPLCVDETVFVNQHLKRVAPPFFVGVGNEKRVLYFEKIKDSCDIYGLCWPKNRLKQHRVHNFKISHKRVRNFINKSIAPLNMTLSQNNLCGLNFRIFEVSACGGLIIINNPKDLSRCYRIRKEAVVYDNAHELNLLIHDIIENPDQYRAIAQAGYERTLSEHTYQKRLEQLISILKKYNIIKG